MHGENLKLNGKPDINLPDVKLYKAMIPDG